MIKLHVTVVIVQVSQPCYLFFFHIFNSVKVFRLNEIWNEEILFFNYDDAHTHNTSVEKHWYDATQSG